MLGGWTVTFAGAGNTTDSGQILSSGTVMYGLRGDYFDTLAAASAGGLTLPPLLTDPSGAGDVPYTDPLMGLQPTVSAYTSQVNFSSVATESFLPLADVGTQNVAARWTGRSNASSRDLLAAPAYSLSARPSGRCCAVACADNCVV